MSYQLLDKGLSYQRLDYIQYVYIESLTNAWIGDGWVGRGLQSCCLTACNCERTYFNQYICENYSMIDVSKIVLGVLCFLSLRDGGGLSYCVSCSEVDYIAFPAQPPFSLRKSIKADQVQVHCINLDAQSVYGLSKLSTGKERDVKTKIKCSRNQSPRTFSQSFPI